MISVHSPSSVMLKKLSLDGTDSDVVLDAELTAACCKREFISTHCRFIRMSYA